MDKGFRSLFLVLVFALVIFSDRGAIGGDGVPRWNALQALMDEGRLTAERFTLLQPLLAAPLYVAGDLWFRWSTRLGPGSPAYQEGRLERIRKVVQRFNKLIVFLIVLWYFLAMRRIFGLGEREAAAASVFLLFGSMLLPQSKDFYSECLWTLTSVLPLSYLSGRGGGEDLPWDFKTLVAFVLPISASVLLNPVLGVAFAAVALCAALPAGGRRKGISPLARAGKPLARWLLLGGGAVALGALLSLGENFLRRGNPLDFGYAPAGFAHLGWFSAPLLAGLAGQLFSPARGILFFVPAFFLGIWLWLRPGGLSEEARRFVLLSLAYSVALLFVYSKWFAWHGAGGWGPRFLLPLSVFGAVYLALWVKTSWRSAGAPARAALALVGAMSVVGYHIGASVNDIHLKECFLRAPDIEACFWESGNFLFASLVRPDDLKIMLTHRSSLVLASGVLLFSLLMRFVPSGVSQSHGADRGEGSSPSAHPGSGGL